MTGAAFKKIIYSHYKKQGRVFPWREHLSPWGVLLSEFMLQQTQTGRVEQYWKRWMEKWPGPQDFHKASLEEALKGWSGLGYNRRCLSLKKCAAVITEDYGGQIPKTPDELILLPGIGPYTAGAIACFAYNYPSVFIETNIRAVMLHFFFPKRKEVGDGVIFPLLEKNLDRDNPRKWYWALMDYGAALKKTGTNPNRRSSGYVRQSAFSGSFRQIRGSLMRSLLSEGPLEAEKLRERMDVKTGEEDFYRALEVLKNESFVAEEGGLYRIGNLS